MFAKNFSAPFDTPKRKPRSVKNFHRVIDREIFEHAQKLPAIPTN